MLIGTTLVGLKGILPEIIILFFSLCSILIGVFNKRNTTKIISILMIIASFLAVITLIYFFQESYQAIVLEGFILNHKVIIYKIILYLLFILVMTLYLAEFNLESNIYKFEYSLLISFSLIGMSIMLSSNNFIVLYTGLELQSLCLYLLAVFDRNSTSQDESGVKYLILGAIASGIFLYGVSLIYGFMGSIDFTYLSASNNVAREVMPIGAIIGFVLIIVAFCFKISAAPFHMWAPDVIEGTSTQTALFISSLAKFSSITVLQHQIITNFADGNFDYKQIIVLVSVLSLIVGSIGGINQISIKRLFAYSSIANMGFVLLGFMSIGDGMPVIVTKYMIVYLMTTIGFFAVIFSLKFKGIYNDSIYAFKGLANQKPYFAALSTIIIFSMVGVPPLAGFFIKFDILHCLINESAFNSIIALIAVLSSVISAFYYLRLIKFMYADDYNEEIDNPNCVINITLFLICIFCVTYMIFSDFITLILYR